MYDSDVAEMFDIVETRRALQEKRADLMAECAANNKLQRRFDQISQQLRSSAPGVSSTPSSAQQIPDDVDDDFDEPEGMAYANTAVSSNNSGLSKSSNSDVDLDELYHSGSGNSNSVSTSSGSSSSFSNGNSNSSPSPRRPRPSDDDNY